MTSILDSLKNIQLITTNYNHQISSLIKILQDELLDDSNKLTQDKIGQIIYNTQIDLIEKIGKDYNMSNRELIKKYVIKPKKEKKSKDNLLQMIDSVNIVDNLAILSNQNILSNLTNITQLNDTQLNDTQLNKYSVQTDNLDFDNYINIEDSPTMKGIIKMREIPDDNSNSDEDDDLVNLLIQNKKNNQLAKQVDNNIDQTNNSDTMQITKSYQPTISTPKKRGRRSKASLLESNQQNNEQINESEALQSFDIIYKSLTIKGKNYLLNLSTNEIFDMENILVGKKKGDKILFKKKFDILDL